MFALSGSGNDYPILCGWNEGHHMYLDVADKSTTDLTFVIKQLKDELYTCLDRFDLIENLNRNSVGETSLMRCPVYYLNNFKISCTND
jgi:hypothetical protein